MSPDKDPDKESGHEKSIDMAMEKKVNDYDKAKKKQQKAKKKTSPNPGTNLP